MFAQMPGEEKLGSEREEITYTARYDGELDPGIGRRSRKHNPFVVERNDWSHRTPYG
jgi:hypothetical protein